MFLGFAFPFYSSLHAVRSRSTDEVHPWLLYWMIFFLFESVFTGPINWLSARASAVNLIIMAFYVYLQLPRFKGVVALLSTFNSFLDNHSDRIEKKLEETDAKVKALMRIYLSLSGRP